MNTSRRSEELTAVAADLIRVHDEWVDKGDNVPSPDASYKDALDALTESFAAGEIPSDCRELAEEVEKLQAEIVHWNKSDRAYPRDEFWTRIEALRQLLDGRNDPVTLDGSHITERRYESEVYGDENGGPEGPPIDIQRFGEMHVVRLILTKWNEAAGDLIRGASVIAGDLTAFMPTPGILEIQDGYVMQLLINSPRRPRNYPLAIFQEPKEINLGAKHSQWIVIASCYHPPGGGKIYDSTIV